MFSGVRRRCLVDGGTPEARLARLNVHGSGSERVWLVASLLLVLAGWAAMWAVGLGWGYGAPLAG